MVHRTELPTTTPGSRDQEVISHPAFGVISVTRPSCGGKGTLLFDSAVGHNDYVCIKVSTAQNHRMLNRNFIHEERMVCEFEMSEAQWAHFVSSGAMGRNTPVTFRHKPQIPYVMENVPGIAPLETMKQTFEKEIRQTAKEYIKEIGELKAKIDGLMTTGKANKTQLGEISHQLGIFLNNFPSNLAFTQNQFAEAMEKTTEAAKTDIEAFVMNLAVKTGLDVLREKQVQLVAAEMDESPLLGDNNDIHS